MTEQHSTRIHTPIKPGADDIARARSLPDGACPRRYCWWWHTLSFDWEIPVAEGCTFLTSEKPPGWPNASAPCKRSEPDSSADHFEPREPHLIEDGVVPIWFFHLD